MKCQHKAPGNPIQGETGVVYYRCLDCGERIESFWRKLSNWKILWSFYGSKGEWWIQDLNAIVNIIASSGLGILFYTSIKESEDTAWWAFALLGVWFIQKLVVFWLGYMDWNHWKVGQRQIAFSLKYDPSMRELIKRVKKIEKKQAPETYEEEGVLDWFKDRRDNEKS